MSGMERDLVAKTLVHHGWHTAAEYVMDVESRHSGFVGFERSENLKRSP